MQAQGRRSSTSKKCATKHVLEKSETATSTKFKKSPAAKQNGEVACIVNREPRNLGVVVPLGTEHARSLDNGMSPHGCSIGLGAELELGHGGLFACGKAWAARGIA